MKVTVNNSAGLVEMSQIFAIHANVFHVQHHSTECTSLPLYQLVCTVRVNIHDHVAVNYDNLEECSVFGALSETRAAFQGQDDACIRLK